MIQIYSKGNTRFDMNGNMVLFPKSCSVSAELNGTWKLDMVHPRDHEGRWRYIEEECIISAPTFMGDRQLFRIREIEKTDDEVTVTALPVFLDSKDDCFLMDVRPTAKNGQEALDIMTAGSKYSGQSNITSAATAYFVERSLADAIIGSGDPTFIGRWGGEILYDNYKIIINERVGGDYGVEARYGKNIEGLEYHLDMTGVVTRIVPVAYNGYKMSGDTPWVDSPHIDKYEKKYIRKIKFDSIKMREDAQEDDEENGVIVCDTQKELDQALSAGCRKLFEEGIDIPVVSITINMVELSRMDEYKEYKILETVSLGDDVVCRHKELDITTKERVIGITWDCIRNRVGKLTLGEESYNYFSNTNSSIDNIDSILSVIGGAIGSDGSVMAEKVRGFLDATKTQLWYQKNVAQRQDVRAIRFDDLDPESEMYGGMALGTQGLQISKKRTADDRDWEWTTALTANGLIANIIVAGILSDKKGLNTWNLDTGEMNMHVMSIVADNFSLSSGETIEDIAKGIVDEQTQEDIVYKLSNGGEDNGIYLKNGKLYISFSAILGEILTLGGANNVSGILRVLGSEENEVLRVDNKGLTGEGDFKMKKYYPDQTNYYYDFGLFLLEDLPYKGQTYTLYGARVGTNTKNVVTGWGDIIFIPIKGWGGSTTPGRGNMIYTRSGFDIYAQHYDDDGFSEIIMNDKEMTFYANSEEFLSYYPKRGGSYPELVRMLKGLLVGNRLVTYQTGTTTGGYPAVFDGLGYSYYELMRESSSSIRYKEVLRDLTSEDVDDIFNIQPVLAKYKKGYLVETDERCDVFYPMFIAEDVEKHAPFAVDHNKDGSVESWNTRIMIPMMFQMIKSQKETIDNLTERLKKIESMMESK